MGVVGDRDLNDAMRAAGDEFLKRVKANYRQAGWTPRPGQEDGAILDGAVQAIFAGFMEEPTELRIEQAVMAAAHMAAIMIFQQTDLESAKADFMRRVDLFGMEFVQDTSAGRG